jgi:hypothetical protein
MAASCNAVFLLAPAHAEVRRERVIEAIANAVVDNLNEIQVRVIESVGVIVFEFSFNDAPIKARMQIRSATRG